MFVETSAVFLADFGVSATWTIAPWLFDGTSITFDSQGVTLDQIGQNAQTGLVIFDAPSGEVLSRRVQSVGYSITFPSTLFVGIAFGDAVTVGGKFFKVLEINSVDDGAFFEAKLQRI